MDEPALEWSVSMARSPLLGLLTSVGARLPLASWRPSLLAVGMGVWPIRDHEEYARLRHETEDQTRMEGITS